MGKYIDADLLRKEIEKHIKEAKGAAKRFTPDMGFFDAKLFGIYDVMAIIDSLQQEQQEVDLEKEIDAIWNPRFNLGWDEKSLLSINHSAFETIARHFYELGLNARKV